MGWLSVWLLTQKSNLHLHRKSCPVRKHLLVILQRSRSCKILFSCAFAFPSSFPYRPLYSQAGIRISSDTSSPVAIFFLCLHNFIGYYFIFVHSTHDDRGLEWRRMPLFLNLWKIQNILLNIRQVFSVGPRRWFKGCRPLANTGICLAVGFLDKIGAGVRKADFTLKARSHSVWKAWRWDESSSVTGGGITDLKTHLLLCQHNPAQSQVWLLLSQKKAESKTETHPSLLLRLDQFVKPEVTLQLVRLTALNKVTSHG